MPIIIVITLSLPLLFFFFFRHDFQLHPCTVKELKLRSHSGNLVLILECKRLKMKRKRTEGETQRATACHHRDPNHFHVRLCLLLNPPTHLFFLYCVPLLLPLAKQTIKTMYVTGRDPVCCKYSRQPTTVFLPGLSCSRSHLIGSSGRTDVSSLMIFVTIKLIDVYGSEMQECEGKRWKGSKLMDREGSGGCLKSGRL